jgi:tetratricopeptide (TPR) repeat protein
MRRHGRLREAEQWIRRAAKAAATTGDREMQTLAQNSLGNVLHDQGKNPQSLRTLRDALRLARRHRLRSLEGEILHDMFVVMTWSGQADSADEYAQGAFEIYREGHPRLAALAHDVASLWILRGYHAQAFTVLKQLPYFIELPDERIRVWGALARAAGGCGETETFRGAADEIWGLLDDPEALLRGASALLELAMGARSIEAWDEAEQAVGRSIEIAARTGESDIERRAQEVLTAISDRRNEQREEPSEIQFRYARQADALVEGFLSSLSEQMAVAV